MKKLLLTSALGLAMVSGPALADQLPGTLSAEIQLIAPGADVSGDFTAEQIEALNAVAFGGGTATEKQRRIEELLDTDMAATATVALPDTLAADIKTMVPDAEIDGRMFSEQTVAQLNSAVYGGGTSTEKARQVAEILDADMAAASAGMALPDTLSAEVMTMFPDANLEGRFFTEAEIAAIEAAVHGGGTAAEKQRTVGELLGM